MTEYTLAEESSIGVALTGAELLGVTQGGIFKGAKISDLAAGGQSNVTYSATAFAGTNTFNGAATFLGAVLVSNSGFSTFIGVTKSAKVGFFGAAGTSQRTSGAQVTMTLSSFTGAASFTVAFISTAQISLLWGQVAEIRQTLVDLGVWKGS